MAKTKEEKKDNKAIRKLKFLLIRIWFVKNWFSIFVMIGALLIASTITGLMPQGLPVLGPISYTLKDSLQEFLEIGNSEFYSLFGSITGIFSLLFSLGYASSKLKAVSYSMINQDKLKKALSTAKLSISDKGKITSIEKHLGMDLDGDNLVGDVPIELVDTNNIMGEILSTFSELSTIVSVDDKILRKAIHDSKEPAEVVVKKPSTPFRSNRL